MATSKIVEEIFRLLKLDEEGSKLFESPAAKLWTSYATIRNKNRDGEMMFRSLKRRYDESTLANMLFAAIPSTMKNKIQDAQRANWRMNDNSVDDIFRLLKLDNEGNKLFQSPAVNIWSSYATKLHEDRAGKIMFQSLLARYDEASLTRMFLAAEETSDTNTVAIIKKLENAQLTNWVATGKSVDDVFRLLQLDDEGTKLFESHLVNMWISYAIKLDENLAGKMVFQSLVTHYHEAILAKMLPTATRSTFLWDFVAKVKDAQFTNWMVNGKTLDDVFRLLKLNDEGSDLFKNGAVTVWAAYATKLNSNRADDMMLASLKAHYTNEALLNILKRGRGYGSAASQLASRLEQRLVAN